MAVDRSGQLDELGAEVPGGLYIAKPILCRSASTMSVYTSGRPAITGKVVAVEKEKAENEAKEAKGEKD